MNGGQLPTNQLHNWGALDHASPTRAPQLMSCNYYVYAHVCVCVCACVCVLLYLLPAYTNSSYKLRLIARYFLKNLVMTTAVFPQQLLRNSKGRQKKQPHASIYIHIYRLVYNEMHF